MSRFYQVPKFCDAVIFIVISGITSTSHSPVDIVESLALWLSTVLLLVLTVAATIVYYYRLKGVGARYEEAKNVVGDVVVSFNKQLQRQEEQLEKTTYRVDGFSSRSESALAKVEDLGRQTSALSSQLTNAATVHVKLTQDVDAVKEQLSDLMRRQESLQKQVLEASEPKIEAAIPIKREHALSPLTETELHVLEFTAEGGEKTAPEIRDFTKLTREHSARLVKKLYEEGYLERDTGKTPYKYRVKDEMLRILKKNEANTQS